jgi:hypothetical protein
MLVNLFSFYFCFHAVYSLFSLLGKRNRYCNARERYISVYLFKSENNDKRTV